MIGWKTGFRLLFSTFLRRIVDMTTVKFYDDDFCAENSRPLHLANYSSKPDKKTARIDRNGQFSSVLILLGAILIRFGVFVFVFYLKRALLTSWPVFCRPHQRELFRESLEVCRRVSWQPRAS